MEKKEKRRTITEINREIEILGRLTSVTEELEDLVKISKGKKEIEPPVISRKEIMSLFKSDKAVATIPKSLLSMFRLLVVKNLIKGRLFSTSYNSGKEIGLSISVKTEKDFLKIAKRFGLGKVDIKTDSPDKVNIKLYNGITSLGVKNVHRPICFFEAGMFAGLLQNIFRRKMNVKETKCRAMGHPYCKFAISKSEYILHTAYPTYPLEVYSQENVRLLTSLASHSITAIENAILFEKTRKQVVVDGLTQIYNHRYFQTRLDVEYKRAKRYRFPLTLIMLDIDNFKKFNDKYGHPNGDTLLKAVALVLVKNVREVDIVARYGGDEFTLILPETGDNGAKIVAKRIKEEIADTKIKVKNKKIAITASSGVITVEPKTKMAKSAQLVEIADRALYRAKMKGKNNIVLVKKT